MFILIKSPKKEKKLRIKTPEGKNIDFGSKGYSDYTIHKDYDRMKRYEARHKKNEDWRNPYTAGFWSKWILWNLPDLKKSIKDTEKRFGIKIDYKKGSGRRSNLMIKNNPGIEELQAETLSNFEIMDKIKNKANLMTYSELMDYDDLDEALGPHEALVLLYETKKNFGHWVTIFKRGNLIEHFDSYGYFPDDELDFIPDYFRKVEGIDYPHLSYLLDNSPYKLSYSEHKLQKHEKDVSTCGRWVISRLLLRHLPLDKFEKMFKNKDFDPDFLVTIFTELI